MKMMKWEQTQHALDFAEYVLKMVFPMDNEEQIRQAVVDMYVDFCDSHEITGVIE